MELPATLRMAVLLAFLAAAMAMAEAASANPTDSIVTGIASWYGEPHHGRRTASGDIFDQDALTAAHPSLPFGTLVRVTNMENGRTVDVRVNDRGPTVRGRILDLSRAAAKKLGAIGAGLVKIRMQILPPRSKSKSARAVAVPAPPASAP